MSQLDEVTQLVPTFRDAAEVQNSVKRLDCTEIVDVTAIDKRIFALPREKSRGRRDPYVRWFDRDGVPEVHGGYSTVSRLLDCA